MTNAHSRCVYACVFVCMCMLFVNCACVCQVSSSSHQGSINVTLDYQAMRLSPTSLVILPLPLLLSFLSLLPFFLPGLHFLTFYKHGATMSLFKFRGSKKSKSNHWCLASPSVVMSCPYASPIRQHHSTGGRETFRPKCQTTTIGDQQVWHFK